MSLSPLYIIRNSIGNDYSHKVYWSLAGGAACYEYYKHKQSLEYLNIFGIASVFWTVVEYKLSSSNIRQGKIQKGDVFGFELSSLSAAILRGCAEGGALTLMGLISADFYTKHLDLEKHKSLLVSLGFMKIVFFGMTVLYSPWWNGENKAQIASKRNILNNKALFLMSVAVGSLLWGLKTDKISKKDKERLKYFVAFETVIGVYWNFLAYFVGYRWLSRSESDGTPSKSMLDQVFGLVYDGAIEISAMYSMFVVIGFAFFKKH